MAGDEGHLSTKDVAAQPDGFPVTVPAVGQSVALPRSKTNLLLILREIPFDCSTKPAVARSHSGYEWEGVLPTPIQPTCNDATGDCTIDIDAMVAATGTGAASDSSGNVGYRIDGYLRPSDETPTFAESTARLLLQGTEHYPSAFR